MKQSISTFEDFPDELFYEVFEYISLEDLYNGFYDLNTRLRSILASLINLHGEITSEKQVQSAAFDFFASRITMLEINSVNLIDLSRFLFVRSLRLHSEPNRVQCQWIECLPHLEHLYVSRCLGEHFYYSFSLSLFVFTNSFPTLRSCQLNLIVFKEDQRWTLVPSLRTLSVCIEDSRVYNQILHVCPSLVHFKLEFAKHFVRLPEICTDCPHLSLRRFNLCLNRTTLPCCQIIDWLVSVVPNLTYFRVQGSPFNANCININSLGAILRHRLLKLRQFHLEMTIAEFVALNISDNDNQKTRKLHPLFNYIQMYPSTENAPARLIIDSKTTF
jgi:hypothetical protein